VRKIEFTSFYDIHFKPKGDKGDNVKQSINNILQTVLDNTDDIVRYEIESSTRSYKSGSGTITTEFSAYIRDGVNMGDGEVDPINDSIWHGLRDAEPASALHSRSTWSLGDVITDNVEHVTSSVDEENRIKTDLDDRSKYKDSASASPEYKQMRTLYPHEFDQAFQSVMNQLRERLKLSNENYKMVRSLVEEKPTNWDCEQCGRENVELHHEMVRSSVKKHFRERLSDLDGFVLDEETGEVFMESTTVTRHIAELVHNPEVLTPLCTECHKNRH
jgi:hypothetical protein